MLELRTPRLHLVAATLEMLETESRDPTALAPMLGARLPSSWPPPLNDALSLRWITGKLAADPGSVGWWMWYFLLDEAARRTAIGNGGFKGRPASGVVEIGYSIVPDFQAHGYAAEAVGALTTWAFGHVDVERIAAETLPGNAASRALLRKLGFRQADAASDPDLLRYEKTRLLSE